MKKKENTVTWLDRTSFYLQNVIFLIYHWLCICTSNEQNQGMFERGTFWKKSILFIILFHNIREECWWLCSRRWTFPPINTKYKGHSIDKFFFFKCNIFFSEFLCIVWIWFIAENIFILQKYLFWCKLKWQLIKQHAPALNRDLSSNFLFADKYEPCEVYKKIYNVYRKVWFSKIIFTNGQNMGLPLWARVKVRVQGVETHSLLKKKFQAHHSKKVGWLVLFYNVSTLFGS